VKQSTSFYEASGKIFIKSRAELETMAVAGHMASKCLEWIVRQVEPGMTTQDIDDLQVDYARREGVVAAPLHYRGFPKSICTAVNEVICHGIPSPKQVLREGDVIGIDVTLVVEGFHGDNAATIPVGEVSPEAMRLLVAALEANRLGRGSETSATPYSPTWSPSASRWFAISWGTASDEASTRLPRFRTMELPAWESGSCPVSRSPSSP
jgi:hypothetical protein